MRFLLDTNVLSEVRTTNGNRNVAEWFGLVSSQKMYLSVLVLGEVRQGVEPLRRRDPRQAAVFDAWMATLERDYSDRLLPVDARIADAWGRLNADQPLPVIDGLLAATARVHDLVVVTRNASDFLRCGVAVHNPCERMGD